MVEFIIETAGKCCSELSASSQLLEVRCVFNVIPEGFGQPRIGVGKKGSFFPLYYYVCVL